jgi:hypothetical protein
MGDSPQSGDNKRSQRLDDELARDPSDVEEFTETDLWESPGHDGIVGATDSDPDRTDLRAEMGKYVSLVDFPTKVKDIIAVAESRDAPADVLAELRKLDPDASYANTAALWEALNLRSDRRF